jgi:cell division protein FtsZ
VGGTASAGRGTGDSGPAAEPPVSATTASAAPATPAAGSQAGTTGTSGTWSVPSSSYSSEAGSGSGYAADTGAARQAGGGGQPGHAADPIAEVPVQPASDGAPGYVPSSVSFVSDDDEEYGAKDGYGGYDRDRGSDAAQGGTPGWKDSGRTGKQDKVFDVAAGRRRPVVFEEEDDLDVPDFLK